MTACNKILILTGFLIVTGLAHADDDDYYRHEHYRDHRDYDDGYYRPNPVYVQPAPNPYYNQAPGYYAPPPQVYYPQPQAVAPGYYAPQPRYYGYQQANPQGLVGQIVGGAMAYEMSNGNPVAAGIGAATGAMLGNQFNR